MRAEEACAAGDKDALFEMHAIRPAFQANCLSNRSRSDDSERLAFEGLKGSACDSSGKPPAERRAPPAADRGRLRACCVGQQDRAGAAGKIAAITTEWFELLFFLRHA